MTDEQRQALREKLKQADIDRLEQQQIELEQSLDNTKALLKHLKGE